MLSSTPLALNVPGAFTSMQENTHINKIKVKHKRIEKLDKHNNGVSCNITVP